MKKILLFTLGTILLLTQFSAREAQAQAGLISNIALGSGANFYVRVLPLATIKVCVNTEVIPLVCNVGVTTYSDPALTDTITPTTDVYGNYSFYVSTATTSNFVVMITASGYATSLTAQAAAPIIPGITSYFNPAVPGPIGGTTPAAGNFTTVTVGTTIQMAGGSVAAGTLQAQIIASGSNSTIIIPANYTEVVATTITVSQSNVTFKCSVGATIEASGTTLNPLIHVTGSGVTFDGCTIDDNNITASSSATLLVDSGAANFRFLAGTFKNVSNYGIYFDNVNGFEVAGSKFYTKSIAINGFSNVSNVNIHDNPYVQGSIHEDTNVNASSASNIQIINNNIVLPAGALSGPEFCVEVGDFSAAGTASITGIQVTGNICSISGTTAANYEYGGFSLPSLDLVGCLVNGNTVIANGQYLTIAMMELGSCSASTNTLHGNDINGQNFNGISVYAGNLLLVGNNVTGWGGNGNGISFYPKKVADNISVAGGSLVQTSSPSGSSEGIKAICNDSGDGATLRAMEIGGGLVIAGSNPKAIEIGNESGGTCPVSVSVNDITINGAAVGVFSYNATVNLGKIRNVGVATPISGATASYEISQLGTDSFGNPFFSTGGAVGSTSFASTTLGWYRIIAAQPVGVLSGVADCKAINNSNTFEYWFAYSTGGYGSPGSVTLLGTIGLYGGSTFGPIDQIEVSGDNGVNSYLDLHIAATSPTSAVTCTFNGAGTAQSWIVPSPVVGATPGSTNNGLWNFNTIPGTTSAGTTGTYHANNLSFVNQVQKPNGAVIISSSVGGAHGSSNAWQLQMSDATGTSQPAFFSTDGSMTSTPSYAKILANCGTMTTTAATTDTLSCSWVTTSSTCTAAQKSGTVVSWTLIAPTAGTVTVTHTATAGGVYAIACSAN